MGMLTLAPHPDCKATADRWTIQASAVRTCEAALVLTFRAAGRIEQIEISAPCEPAFAERLWKHTCFEAFVALDGGRTYHELNLAPSGAWAIYTFDDYRSGTPLREPRTAPTIEMIRSPSSISVAARLPLAQLCADYVHADLAIGLTAVVEDAEGRLSYWALRHCGQRPDFHDRRSFSLRVEACPQS